MSLRTAQQFDYLEAHGLRTFEGNPTLTNPEAVFQLQSAINARQVLLVGSSIVGTECLPQVVETIESNPAQYSGTIIFGTGAMIGRKVTLQGCVVEDVDVRGDGAIFDGHAKGGNFVFGDKNAIEGRVSLFNCTVENADVKGQGAIHGGHIQGYIHLVEKQSEQSTLKAPLPVFLDQNWGEATDTFGTKIDLTPNEVILFGLLNAYPGELVTSNQLMTELYMTRNNLRSHIYNLRSKIHSANFRCTIKTSHNRGYYLK